MRIDRAIISANIRNYIEQNKAIHLPLIGNITLVNVPAGRSILGDISSPPQQVLQYRPAERIAVDDFIDFLSRESKFEKVLCESSFTSYCKSLVADLEILGKATVSDLGTFYEFGKKIRFTPATSMISKASYGLPIVNLKPLVSIVDQKRDVRDEIMQLQSEKGFGKIFWNSVSVAAIFLLLLFAYQNLKTVDFSLTKANPISTLEFDQNRLNKKPEKVLVEDAAQELIPGNVSKEPSSAACALILGSFSKESNAVALQERILSSEYQLYTEEFHEFFRIGVSFDCEEVKSSTFHRVEADFGIDPWLRIDID